MLFAITIRSLVAPGKPPQQPEERSEVTTVTHDMSRPVTESELAAATGGNGKSLFVAVKDPHADRVSVFDVASGSDFYGPGGPYHLFAGKNATHGLALSSTKPEEVTGDLSKLTASQKDTHMQWYEKYVSKYPIVGYLVPDGYVQEEQSSLSMESKKDA